MSTELVTVRKKHDALEEELSQTQDELAMQSDLKNNIEETLTVRIHDLEEQVNGVSLESATFSLSRKYHVFSKVVLTVFWRKRRI